MLFFDVNDVINDLTKLNDVQSNGFMVFESKDLLSGFVN